VDIDELGRAADINIAHAWAAMGRAMGAAVAEGPALTLVATGVPIPFFNGAYPTDPSADPVETIAEAIDFFRPHGVGWLLWVREGVAPALLDAGRHAGLRDAGGPPAMGVAPIPMAPPAPAGLEIAAATTVADLRDQADLLRDAFGVPQDLADRFAEQQLLDDDTMCVFVGRVDGEPVSCSLLAISGRTAGVYNVATSPHHRGKGYGAALTWAVVAEGGRRGCTHAILQASQLGYPVYKRMGFVDLGNYVQLQGG
jgi:GNAT superfamily N-acetyltransferase